MAEHPDPLEAAVAEFLLEIFETLNGVLPNVPNEPFAVQSDSQGRHLAIRQTDTFGLPLQADGVTILGLTISFRCMWNSDHRFLAIEESSFGLWTPQSNEPLMRFDYVRSPSGGIPGAHVQVHAHRDEAVFAMMMAARRNRGRQRDWDVLRGVVPRFQDLHIPVGGPRFRPCIEDVLEFAVLEFGIDTVADHQIAIDNGRIRYRGRQLKAAVSDNPRAAAEELRSRGYSVTFDGEEPTSTARARSF